MCEIKILIMTDPNEYREEDHECTCRGVYCTCDDPDEPEYDPDDIPGYYEYNKNIELAINKS